MRLYVALPSGTGTGWTICSNYLRQELSKLTDFIFLTPEHELWGKELDGILFTSIADATMVPSCPSKAKKVMGYSFFENILPPQAEENLKQYDHIYVGAKWCVDKLAEKGFKSETLYQGVDNTLFYPKDHGEANRPIKKLFSGGKFELRKGQDIVMASYKELIKKNPELELHVLWDNPWPISIDTMRYSPYIHWQWQWHKPFKDNLVNLFKMNDISLKNVNIIPATPYEKLNEVYWNTDLGLFPNRCEGGTNLVLMEYMACGRPAMCSQVSGHVDLWIKGKETSYGIWPEDKISYEGQFEWSDYNPDYVVLEMKHFIKHLNSFNWPQGESFKWSHMAKQVYDKYQELCK